MDRQLKNPKKAMWLSLLLGAGAGQIYNGQKFKGVLMIVLFFGPLLYVTYFIITIYMKFFGRIAAGDISVIGDYIAALRANGNIGPYSNFIAIIWIISIIDAYVAAAMFNRNAANAKDGEDGGGEKK